MEGTGEDTNQAFTYCYFGTKDEIIRILCFTQGDVEEFHKKYEDLRNSYLTSTQPGWEQNEVGPIEDKFFFFLKDTLRLNPPLVREWFQIDDEWNAFQYIQTSGHEKLRRLNQKPADLEALELWRKRSIPYQEAVIKVGAATIITPRPSKQRQS